MSKTLDRLKLVEDQAVHAWSIQDLHCRILDIIDVLMRKEKEEPRIAYISLEEAMVRAQRVLPPGIHYQFTNVRGSLVDEDQVLALEQQYGLDNDEATPAPMISQEKMVRAAQETKQIVDNIVASSSVADMQDEVDEAASKQIPTTTDFVEDLKWVFRVALGELHPGLEHEMNRFERTQEFALRMAATRSEPAEIPDGYMLAYIEDYNNKSREITRLTHLESHAADTCRELRAEIARCHDIIYNQRDEIAKQQLRIDGYLETNRTQANLLHALETNKDELEAENTRLEQEIAAIKNGHRPYMTVTPIEGQPAARPLMTPEQVAKEVTMIEESLAETEKVLERRHCERCGYYGPCITCPDCIKPTLPVKPGEGND